MWIVGYQSMERSNDIDDSTIRHNDIISHSNSFNCDIHDGSLEKS